MGASSTTVTQLSEALRSVDLKGALIGAGVVYPQEVYDAVACWARFRPPGNPYFA